jgi:hypothetical protein
LHALTCLATFRRKKLELARVKTMPAFDDNADDSCTSNSVYNSAFAWQTACSRSLSGSGSLGSV